jgi:hypothetical protein
MNTDKTLQTLALLTNTWFNKLKLGRHYNATTSIGFGDEEYELLTCVENELKGCGSISHGYDHTDKSETKGTSWVQPKKCLNCHSKLHFFSEKCICGSDKFSYINDSRWGIDAEAHFRYKIPKYHLWHFFPEKYSFDCDRFKLEKYEVDSHNKHFDETLKSQIKFGKNKSKNFMPKGCDFYSANPKITASFTFELNEIYGISVIRNMIEEIIYDEKVVQTMKKVLDDNFIITKNVYSYNELEPHINISNKKTTHGKSRGQTQRRTEQVI